MKTQMPKKDRDELLKRLAALVPFAKGSVCVSHKPCGAGSREVNVSRVATRLGD